MTAVVGKPNFDFWEVAIVTVRPDSIHVFFSLNRKGSTDLLKGGGEEQAGLPVSKKCQKQAVMKISSSLQCFGEREKLPASALRAALKPRVGAASDFTDRLCSLNFPLQGARSTIAITSSSTQSTKKG